MLLLLTVADVFHYLSDIWQWRAHGNVEREDTWYATQTPDLIRTQDIVTTWTVVGATRTLKIAKSVLFGPVGTTSKGCLRIKYLVLGMKCELCLLGVMVAIRYLVVVVTVQVWAERKPYANVSGVLTTIERKVHMHDGLLFFCLLLFNYTHQKTNKQKTFCFILYCMCQHKVSGEWNAM